MEDFSTFQVYGVLGGKSVFDYFSQSNAAGQVIIFILLCLSVVAWTVLISKGLELKKMRRLNSIFELRLRDITSLQQVDFDTLSGRGTVYYAVFREALEASRRYVRAHGSGDQESENQRMKHVENALHRAVADGTQVYERHLLVLGTVVSSAPFLGLLGTVWGVMDAFGSVAVEGSATLQALAPGVSGALLTTVMALLVAIPSVAGYNYILSNARRATAELENFASSLADSMELDS